MADASDLSEREREILYLVATGASNKEIASALFISSNTVKVHLRNIFSKIGANSRTEAAMFAVSTGILAVPASQSGISENLSRDRIGIALPEDSEARRPSFRRTLAIGLLGLFLMLSLVYLFRGQIFGRQNNFTNAQNLSAVEPRWQSLAPMPSARRGIALAVLGNQLFAIGGETESDVTGTVERYSPKEDRWERVASKPTPVTEVQAAIVGGRIYVPGGKLSSGEVVSTLEIYDPTTDSWEPGSPIPDALSGYALTTFEGKFFIFGGWDGTAVVDSVYEYNPDSNEWIERSSMPTARAFAGAAVSEGQIYVFGGFDGEKPLSVNELYLPANEGGGSPWEIAEPLPSPRYRMGVASLADIIHVIGGIGIDNTAQSSLQFPPQTQEWESYDNPLTGTWSQMGIGAAGTHIYVVGGELNGAPTTNNLSYQAIYLVNFPVVR
jgi:DNA-binding CsgD family transcriptional regulator/N-acetylneuraminic acid mutarotase